MHGDEASTATHIDFLPLESCCAMAKMDSVDNASLSKHELVDACPGEDVKVELAYDEQLEQCLKSTTTMNYGDYQTSEPKVVLRSECCEAGNDNTPPLSITFDEAK